MQRGPDCFYDDDVEINNALFSMLTAEIWGF